MPVGWEIAIVVLWVAVIALAVVVLGVLRQITPLLEQAAAHPATFVTGHDGPPVGEEVPHFSARDGEGNLVDDQELRGRPALLLFLSPGCEPCEQLAAELGQADLGALASQLIVVTSQDGPGRLAIPAGLRTVTESSGEMSRPLAVASYPFAIAVDPAGIVKGSRVPNTVEQLGSLAAVLA